MYKLLPFLLLSACYSYQPEWNSATVLNDPAMVVIRVADDDSIITLSWDVYEQTVMACTLLWPIQHEMECQLVELEYSPDGDLQLVRNQ